MYFMTYVEIMSLCHDMTLWCGWKRVTLMVIEYQGCVTNGMIVSFLVKIKDVVITNFNYCECRMYNSLTA